MTERIRKWHEMTETEQVTPELKKSLVVEEFAEVMNAETLPQFVKEVCDLIFVCENLAREKSIHLDFIQFLKVGAMEALYELDFNAERALEAVTDSNYSKLIKPKELDDAKAHFDKLGLIVQFKNLGEYFGAYSAKDQVVLGKYYPKGKLLKPHCYKPVDDSKRFW